MGVVHSRLFMKVIARSLNEWQKERQIHILNDKKGRRVKAIRDNLERVIDAKELVVGDIVVLEPGEIVPCDGVLVYGHNVKCDESSATGESDAIKKTTYDDCITPRELAEHQGTDGRELDVTNIHTDCFMISGSKVLEGYGKYVVIAVGKKTSNGRIMMGTPPKDPPIFLRWLNRSSCSPSRGP